MASTVDVGDSAMAQHQHEEPSACRLKTLPAELRSEIMELAFTTPKEVNILKTSPPCKSLILTCRQFHNEAAAMYKAAYRHSWTTSTFVLEESTTHLDSYEEAIKILDEQDVEQISNFMIRGLMSTFIMKEGLWIEQIPGRDDVEFAIIKEVDVHNMFTWLVLCRYSTGSAGHSMAVLLMKGGFVNLGLYMEKVDRIREYVKEKHPRCSIDELVAAMKFFKSVYAGLKAFA
ncbi:hypothetical protein LTR36_010387 [Oleoguttula mirabilis]|uniref:F-box domain-containing protein n=1 Tax=Oleoguttula mirabilis TaxID=1507867 RepID=A0AAV9J4U1_9PEZI|nr:hypothetical protein LTR36_010387 [Oleoguttula mirabilis]